MSDPQNVIPLPSSRPRDAYVAAQSRITELLLRHVLIDSFFNFVRDGKPYPFLAPGEALPTGASRSVEHPQQNTVLLALIDGVLPRPLNKHFRLRASNRVAWRNIQRIAPELDLSDFKAAHCQVGDPAFGGLLTQLLSLDYALLAERLAAEDGNGEVALTHMHVKVERLTDNAIKGLGKSLGLIERRLFERGEDYVEALEGKYFEYYGFTANASGRKSAAAMAAQLLAEHDLRFTVFVAGQEDGRLTLLQDGDGLRQYMLISLADTELEALADSAAAAGIADLAPYSVSGSGGERRVVLFRLDLRRTDAARASSEHGSDRRVAVPWLEIAGETVLPLPGTAAPPIAFAWAEEDDRI